jgi:nitrogen-specific signal transduction histidine kinase/CheY-like chemotaxis protein
LVRTVKLLDEAYKRLERFSQKLALMQEAAEEARRAKQMFVANVSHELRTPLNIIIGFSEMLAFSPESHLQEGDDLQAIPPQFIGDVNRIYRCASHLKSLIDDILDLSQMDASRMALVTERASIEPIINEVFELMEHMALRKGLVLQVELERNIRELLMDRLRIRQVLLNLVSNAIRFTDSGKVVISTRQKDREVIIEVADTGPGIAEEDLVTVFEDFRQLDMSSSKRFGGTGLGLSISRRLIEMHGGRMGVESQLRQGSRFYFTLPLAGPSELNQIANYRASFHAAQFNSLAEQTVIVVNTDPVVVNLLKRHLTHVKVLGVTPQDLPAAMERFLPMAVIASQTPSQEAPAWLDQAVKIAPVITCPLPDPSQLSRVLGIDHYLLKPVTRERLLEILEGYGPSVQRILIVDDDLQFAELLERTIQTSTKGYSVRIASGGQEGMDRMEEEIPHLVLLDIQMDGLDGLSILQKMRSHPALHGVPVTIVSARDLPSEHIGSLEGQIILQTQCQLNVSQVLGCVQAMLDSLSPTMPGRRREAGTLPDRE